MIYLGEKSSPGVFVSKRKEFFDRFSDGVLRAASKFKTQPYEVSPAQFWSIAENSVDEWEVRSLGGFTGIRDTQFPVPPGYEKDILPRKTIQIGKIQSPFENFTVHTVNIEEAFSLAALSPTDIFRVVIQSDTHVPEHDPTAMTAFCAFLRYYKPHGLINIGDFMEMGAVSHWTPLSPEAKRLTPEILLAQKLLRDIDKAAGPQCVLKRFLIGNHESWLDQLLIEKVPEVYDNLSSLGVDLRIQELLGLKDLGYRVIPLNEILQIGHMHYIHGYYTGKYHASKHLDVFGVNLIYGHVHDVSQFSGVSVKGIYSATSIGCLRTLNAPFLKGKPNNWRHGFGIVEYRIDGTFTQYVPTMVNGGFSFNGKKF